MSGYSQEDLREARRAIASTLSKSEKALTKLKEGTFQHTMTAKGIQAYRIAIALIESMLGEVADCTYERDELDAALEAIKSAKSRVENILPKFEPGTPQHTLAVRRVAAFRIAAELIRMAATADEVR